MGKAKSRPAKEDRRAFTADETAAVGVALGKLYRRHIFHLVEPKFPRTLMADVWRTFIPQERWDHLAIAQEMMVMPANTWQYFAFEDAVDFGTECRMEIKTKRLLPRRHGLPDPVIPPEYVEFADAVLLARVEWMKVWDTYLKLNLTATRLTAAHNWPCVSALLALGGRPATDLDNITRPGNINGALSVACRDTSAFVMQHMLLPPIDTATEGIYEGDEDTGLAARLVLTENHGVYGNVLWPLRD